MPVARTYGALEIALSDPAFAVALQRMLRAGENGVSYYDRTRDGRNLKDDGVAGKYTREGLQVWAGAKPDGDIKSKSINAIKTKLGLRQDASEAQLVDTLHEKLQKGGFFDPQKSAPVIPKTQVRASDPSKLKIEHAQAPVMSVPEKTPISYKRTTEISSRVVVLDAGHGAGKKAGYDPGSIHYLPDGQPVYEKTLNILLTKDVASALKAKGYEPVLTHEGENWDVPKGQTWQEALTSTRKDAAVFVSIHHNVNGPRKIIYGASEASATFAKKMGESINVPAKADVRDLAVVQNNHNLRADGSERLAVIFEAGEMHNSADRDRIMDPAKRRAYAKKIAEGIIHAMESPDVKLAMASHPAKQKMQAGAVAEHQVHRPNISSLRTFETLVGGTPAKYQSTKDGEMAFVHLEHSPGQSGQVALFLPKGFDLNKPAIIVPYFHGHGGSIPDAIDRQLLTKQAAESGKNVAFVIPQLGIHSDIKAQYQNPEFVNKFLAEAAGGLTDLYTHTHPGADTAKILQAFHQLPLVPVSYSGGYKAVMPMLNMSRVQGVVLLDSMYSDSAPFTNFSKRGDAPFVSIVYGPSTQNHSQEFAQNALKGTAFVSRMNGDHSSLVQSTLGSVLKPLAIHENGKVGYGGTPAILLASSSVRAPASMTY